jgi:hypothetical protein
MDHDRRQVLLLASILVFKHGDDAPAVAADRVHVWTEAHDPETADLWRAVGEAVVLRLAQPRKEPTLPEVLDGTVTRLTMDADKVNREDVEAIMVSAQEKRQRKA